MTELQNAIACAGRILELIEAQPQTPDPSPAQTLPSGRGHVGLRHVFFSYSPDKKLIEDFNLSVKPGQRVAIVGPTGCGKTTLINLLMRFYDVDQGEICLENTDIRKLRRAEVRSSYGMVAAGHLASQRTVRDNIRMGRRRPQRRKWWKRQRKPMPTALSAVLPKGYDTVIGGERRKSLSGPEAASLHCQSHALPAADADSGRGYLFH